MGSSGLSLGAITNDFNSLTGNKVNTIDAAAALYGLTPEQINSYLTSGDKQGITNAANYLGISANELADWSNKFGGTQHTGAGVTDYLNQGPTTTSNLMDLILNSRGGTSGSTQSSGGQSSSHSGLDWNNSPVSKEFLTEQANRLPGLAEESRNTLYNRYQKMMNDALGDKGSYANVLNQMGGRGMGQSSVASDALAQTGLGIARDIGDKAYTSDIAGLQAQMQVPTTLGNLAALGNVSDSQSSSSSSGSSWSDPGNSANLGLLVDMLGGNMFT
jgi:hypothetical protein